MQAAKDRRNLEADEKIRRVETEEIRSSFCLRLRLRLIFQLQFRYRLIFVEVS